MKNKQDKASTPHELLMMDLSIFHLILPVAGLSSGYLSLFLTISLIGSAVIIFWIAYRAHQKGQTDLVHQHWQLAWKRCRWLLIAYMVSIGIMLLGWLLASLQVDHNMYTIFLVVFSRIAVVPTILMMMVLFVLETTALSQAKQNEYPG